MNIKTPAIKNKIIDTFIRCYGVDMSEAEESDAHQYEDFNAFFTRTLKAEARPIVSGDNEVACPVDGYISQIGNIQHDRLFQAKGHSYTLNALLGGDSKHVQSFNNGKFATLYLAPKNYHRIHMPISGTLREMIHIPGKLFSVQPATVDSIPNLFAINERVVCVFETEVGPMAIILIGAMIVASINLKWHGTVSPPTSHIIHHWPYPESKAPHLERGKEMGFFELGSTAIVLFGPDAVTWSPELTAESEVRMGQLFGTLHTQNL